MTKKPDTARFFWCRVLWWQNCGYCGKSAETGHWFRGFAACTGYCDWQWLGELWL